MGLTKLEIDVMDAFREGQIDSETAAERLAAAGVDFERAKQLMEATAFTRLVLDNTKGRRK